MIFLIGLLISFLGQLPIGVINLYALKITTESGVKYAIRFSFGVVLVEMLYLVLTLFIFKEIQLKSTLYFWIQIFVVVIFISLSLVSFMKWRQESDLENKFTMKATASSYSFFKGVMISALNLAQFPFWMLWTAYLTNLALLKNQNFGYQIFTLGTGFGTVSGMLVYIYGCKFFFNRIKKMQKHLQLIISFFFLLAAFIEIANMMN